MRNQWFDVDKEGLSRLIDQQGKGRLVGELLQNALDENVTTVAITITPLSGKPLAEIVVEDDSPEGFQNLAHAYTLFADSKKKGNPEKRGRFNLGEKLVLALCRSATISTTTGTVVFEENGLRQLKLRSKRARGSEFRAVIRMNRTEYDEAIGYLNTVLIPDGIAVTLNGQTLQPRQPIHTFQASLETVIADEQGVLRTRTRKTRVELFATKAGETPTFFELGLPVVATNDKWHINVCQKVPINMNRDNVRPAFLQRLRTLVFNEMHSHLNEEDANATWATEASSHSECSPSAIKKYLDLKFGERRASFDPNDPEAGKRFVSMEGTVITGSMLNSQQWQNAKQANAIESVSRICPSPRPYSNDLTAPTEQVLPPEQWTTAMRAIVEYAKTLAHELMGVPLAVKITYTQNPFLACYGDSELTFNLRHLGHAWFEQGLAEAVDELLIHEFGHEYCGDHLSDKYHKALCKLGAKLKQLAVVKPGLMCSESLS